MRKKFLKCSRSGWGLALTLLLFCLVRPASLRTLSSLLQEWRSVLPGQSKHSLWRQVGIPGAGLEHLPSPTPAGLRLLKAHEVPAFSLSTGWLANVEIHQRIVESAYPVRLSNRAPYRLQLATEAVPDGWSTRGATGGVLLVHRP